MTLPEWCRSEGVNVSYNTAKETRRRADRDRKNFPEMFIVDGQGKYRPEELERYFRARAEKLDRV